MKIIKSIMDFLTNTAQLLVLIGALSWGLIGYSKIDAVVMIFPRQFVNTVYITIGIAALFLITQRFF
jgi:uncharacterized membrane protein YuzA (DUF378 family)